MLRFRTVFHATAVVAALTAAPLGAQVQVSRATGAWVGAPVEEYTRLLQLTGVMPLSSLMLRPSETATHWAPPDSATWRAPWRGRYAADSSTRDSSRLSVTVLAPVIHSAFNSAVPYGTNDGALWAGRGLSAQVTGGARMQMGRVTLQLAPTVAWSQNRAFVLGPLRGPAPTASPFADSWLSARIDRPQRFGNEAYARLDWGQSALSATFRGVRAGVSSENMWWGPGVDNALLMTNNAPGFPHLFLATRKPANVGIGTLDVLYTLGSLTESGWWRTAADTFPSDRFLNALAFVFEPRGAPGMYFGAARVFNAYLTYNPLSLREILQVARPFPLEENADSANPTGKDRRDQMLSGFFRWVFPQTGFEAYGEIGRADHNWNWRDFALEPDHTRAYMLGARKVFRVSDGLLSFRVEATSVSSTTTMIVRTTPIWYSHSIVQQGYTQRGQVIGAGIGPGSDAQTFSVDWLQRRGRLGFVIQRHRDNTDSWFRANRTLGVNRDHDTYLSVGPRLTVFAGPVDVDTQCLHQHEYNRYSIFHNDLSQAHCEIRGQVRWP